MAFVTPDDVERAADYGAQVCHGNAVWPYYPLRRDGGRLDDAGAAVLRGFVDRVHRRGMRFCLGLPPFPSVACLAAHPDWRIHPDPTDAALRVTPREDDLGTRLACNNGPWGEYLIDLCVELLRDFGLDGFSFDGNYHPPICFCPACRESHRADTGRPIPPRVDLADVAYRQYLAWRGERLERHYGRLQERLKAARADAVITTWSVNAGRYGHLIQSPRSMPTRLNRLFDLPMQEWWMDETNIGASVAPAFGAAYARATGGDRPVASEAYLMSRGNPYGTDSFPVHERVTRALLALTHGCVAAESLGWPGHRESTKTALDAIRAREGALADVRPLRWAGMLVSEQTRQFAAWRDIPERFLPHVYGAFRMGLEERLPLTLLNDWDIAPDGPLSECRVLILPGASALSDAQCDAIRAFVRAGGGLVATGESSRCDPIGQPRPDFALADLFGVSHRGTADGAAGRTPLDAHFAATLSEEYWSRRTGIATLAWEPHPILTDARLDALVPQRRVTFKGPMTRVSEPAAGETIARMVPAGDDGAAIPAVVARRVGRGRVVYLAACVDAALWSYAYPYQRRMLARLVAWAAGDTPPPVTVDAPMCVHATFWRRPGRIVVQCFNDLDTAARHGLPAMEVPLREETVPIHGIRVRVHGGKVRGAVFVPGGRRLTVTDGAVTLPPLERQGIVVFETG